MPRAIVGYLSDKQAQITSLTITTDTTCGDIDMDATICHLRGFNQLRSISWTAISAEEADAFGLILRSSAAHLREIKFDQGSPESSYYSTKNYSLSGFCEYHLESDLGYFQPSEDLRCLAFPLNTVSKISFLHSVYLSYSS